MRRPAYTASRLLGKLLLSPIVSPRVIRPEATNRPGPFILAANHISHFDPPLISSIARREIDWMAMAELFKNPIAATWLRTIGTFPVDRNRVDRLAVRTALKRLEQGHVVGMFPEGGIRNGKESVLEGAPIRPGVGALTQMSKAPVIPCVIIGSDQFYRVNSWLPFRRTRLLVSFGEEMRCTDAGKEARQRFEQELGHVFRQLSREMEARFDVISPMRQKSA